MRIKLLLILFCFGLCLGSVSTKINAVINKPALSKVAFGVQILNAADGSVVYSHNSDRLLMPASNMKIFTTAAALKVLGPDYKFSTKVFFHNGNLVIKGSGDPLLGDTVTLQKYGRSFGWEFNEIVNGIKAGQIMEIKDIIVDSSVFDDQLVHPSWPVAQLNRDYAPQVCGINYNGNCIEITAYPSGGTVAYTKSPDTGYISISNQASVTRERKNTIWVSRLAGTNNMTLYGKCYQKALPVQVTVHRPAVYFGYILAEQLIKNGISLTGSIVERHTDIKGDAKALAEFNTDLKDVMIRSNRDSFNLAAECLAKKISSAKTAGGIGGQWKHCGQIIKEYLEGAGIAAEGFEFDDGCGLSRNNKVSADMLARVLLEVYKSDDRQLFMDTLAVGGVRGSSPVRKYFTEPQYKGRIYAKSGTIDGVKAMSGYCDTNGGVFVFSVITNSANGYARDALNDIVKAIFTE